MTSSRPDLSVIVVSHNGAAMVLDTLRSAHERAGGLHVEWFVVDSGSTDGTPDAVESAFPDIRLFRRPNIGFAAANNVALRHARGRYVLLLNPDVEIREGTLRDLVGALDVRPEVGAASVTQVDPRGRNLYSIRRFPSPLRKLGESLALDRWTPIRSLQERDVTPQHYQEERSVDWVVGAFIAIRRGALEDVGPLDERFFLYAEEKDWCYRLHEAGWDVRHLPRMSIVHFGAERGRAELIAQLSHSTVLFAAKHLGSNRVRALRLALVTGHVLRALLMAPLAVRRADIRERLRGEQLAARVVLGLAPPPFARSGGDEAAAAA